MKTRTLAFPVLGLTGTAGSGKDTVASIIGEHIRINRYALASPIKQAISAMLGLPENLWEDRDWKDSDLPSFGVPPRYLAQTLGTEWARKLIGEDFWIKIAEERFFPYATAPVVITDVRFNNEARWIREKLGGTVLRVVGPREPHMPAHSSEQGIEPMLVDGLIDNRGSMDQLRQNVLDHLLVLPLLMGILQCAK